MKFVHFIQKIPVSFFFVNSDKLWRVFRPGFHDRFWIANECCGFIAGTSLNGIGKKYSSINIMDKDDVINIVKLLQ